MTGLPPPNSPCERRDRIRLIRSQNVGPVSFRQLLERFGSAGAALEALPDLARRGGVRKALRLCDADTAERETDAVTKLGGRQIILGDRDYPEPLAAIPDAPPVLSVLGDAGLLGRSTVGIVGARNASTNGRRLAETLARDLSAAGVVVASGLARGIDAAAHAGALQNGTVAVVAGGIDVIYPKENTALYEAIVAQGAVVSEAPPGIEPQARHFPTRNRIISGLSLGIVVVEAALRSGSLITARLAGEQGREVFAVPGSPLDPRARGTNDLLRNGASLTETADDVLDGIRGMREGRLGEPSFDGAGGFGAGPGAEENLDGARAKLLECLGPAPVSVDSLVRDSGLPAGAVWTILLELELAGRLERQPGGFVALLF
jgi:DNA processing protein